MTRPPTAERPLLGQTVLVVEDSRYACEALRMICQRSGARIRRADSLRSAARHLRTYRPGIAIIDLGLPDGSGLDLIQTLSSAEPPIDVIMAMSGDDQLGNAARAAGASIFFPKPITSIGAFQAAILAELPKHARPNDIRPVITDEVVPDRIALRDDLALAFDLLSPEPDPTTLAYVTNFLMGLAKSAGDRELSDCVEGATGASATSARVDALKTMVMDRLKREQAV